MSKRITFKAMNGQDASGEISEPSGSGKVAGIILLQEWFGINEHLRSMANRFAGEGYLVLTADLYRGKVAKDANEGAQMMTALDRAQAMSDIGGAITALKEHARCSGKIGVVGFCMGGAYAFGAAAMLPGVSAAVPFYGIPDPSAVDLSKIAIPVQAHFSKTDEWAKPEVAEAVQKKLGSKMELYLYDGGHAFMRDNDPEKHHPACAKQAWERATAFLKKHLS